MEKVGKSEATENSQMVCELTQVDLWRLPLAPHCCPSAPAPHQKCSTASRGLLLAGSLSYLMGSLHGL